MLPKSRLLKELYSASALNVSYWPKSGRGTNGQTSPSLTRFRHQLAVFGTNSSQDVAMRKRARLPSSNIARMDAIVAA